MVLNNGQSALEASIEKRRTFAIISHPDAGKTTLTEKLLLFGERFDLLARSKVERQKSMLLLIGWKLKSSVAFLSHPA